MRKWAIFILSRCLAFFAVATVQHGFSNDCKSSPAEFSECPETVYKQNRRVVRWKRSVLERSVSQMTTSELTLSPCAVSSQRCQTSFSRAARGQQTSQRVPKCHGNKHQLRPSNLRQVSGLNGVTGRSKAVSTFSLSLSLVALWIVSCGGKTPCEIRFHAANKRF